MDFDLDAPCGSTFRFRDLTECGATFAHLAELHRAGTLAAPPANLPQDEKTWHALHGLAVNVLDPAVARFGAMRLTYGFAGAALIGAVRRRARDEKRPPRIAPDRDQHAGHEMRHGKRICQRGGAAVDLIIDGVSSRSVAQWIVANTPFDRLYFYGEASPFHVSWNVVGLRAAYDMLENGRGRVPRPW